MEKILEYGQNIFDGGIVIFLISTILIFLASYIINKLIKKYLVKAIPTNSKSAQTSWQFYITTLRVLVTGISIFIVLSNIKPLSGLGKVILGASSVLAVIVGLAAQETLGNFIAGFILSIFQPFHVGDTVILKEKDISGVVKNIGFRHTVLKTLDNTEVVVPNSIMNNSIIENKETKEKIYRNSLIINISYSSDLKLAKEIIEKNCITHPQVIDGRNISQKRNKDSIVKIFCTNFNDYSIELKAIFFTKNFLQGFETCSDLRESILKDFNENDIDIPLPTTVIKKID